VLHRPSAPACPVPETEPAPDRVPHPQARGPLGGFPPGGSSGIRPAVFSTSPLPPSCPTGPKQQPDPSPLSAPGAATGEGSGGRAGGSRVPLAVHPRGPARQQGLCRGASSPLSRHRSARALLTSRCRTLVRACAGHKGLRKHRSGRAIP